MKKWILIPGIIFFIIIVLGIYRFNFTNDDIYVIKNGKTVQIDDANAFVYTSFYPLYFLTKEMVGESINVQNLVPNGGEPHEYEPSIVQMQSLTQAKAVIVNGLGIEGYLPKIQENYARIPTIVVSDKVHNLIALNHDQTNFENTDPHIWLSPKMMLEMVDVLAPELQKIVGKNDISKNVVSLREKMQKLDENYTKTLASCKQKEFVTSHEAFGYLARDYGLTQHAVLGISPEEEPSLKAIADLIHMIQEKNLKSIYSEALVSQKFVQTIQKETDVNIYTLNALETLTPEQIEAKENYFTIMEKNLEALKTGLECDTSPPAPLLQERGEKQGG